MTVGELLEAFQGLVDDSIDNSLFLLWLNEAQEQISIVYGPLDTDTFTATAGVYYDLPTDYLSPCVMRDADGNEYIDYFIDADGHIAFTDDGTYTFTYHRTPTKIPTGDSSYVSELHELLHSPMVYYVAANFYDRESGGDQDESNQATKMYQKFNSLVADRVKTLRARRRKTYTFIPMT